MIYFTGQNFDRFEKFILTLMRKDFKKTQYPLLKYFAMKDFANIKIHWIFWIPKIWWQLRIIIVQDKIRRNVWMSPVGLSVRSHLPKRMRMIWKNAWWSMKWGCPLEASSHQQDLRLVHRETNGAGNTPTTPGAGERAIMETALNYFTTDFVTPVKLLYVPS